MVINMIKDNQKLLNRIHILIDAIIIAAAYIAAYYLRFRYLARYAVFKLTPGERYYPLSHYARYLVFIIPAFLIFYSICGLYKPKRQSTRKHQFINLIAANLLGVILFVFFIYMKKDFDISRYFLGVFVVLNFVLDALFRIILSTILYRIRNKGFNQKHILLVGYSRAAEGYIDRIKSNPQWGYHIFGILDDNKPAGTRYKLVPVIGSTQDLETILANNTLDEIAVTLSLDEYAKLEYVVGICEKSGVHTKFIPDYNKVIPTVPYIEDLSGLPVINIRHVPLSNTFNATIKRLFDIIVGFIALVVFSIPMLITAIIIKCTSKGPIIFSQVRVGLHNKEFKMYKFRSMEVQTESAERGMWTTKHDPRVTKIGKIIRKTSIDELPQIFNVLKGDMSLVGPRPERPFFVEKFKEEIPRYMIKHQVRPGMTGWAQVNGLRGDTSIKKRIDCDLYYIENWSLEFDIRIMFLTVFRGFINKNAY